MKRISIFLFVLVIGKYLSCSAQNYSVEDLYGIWIPIDREAASLQLDLSDEKLFDSETALKRRRSLLIVPEEIAYIPGGYEIVDKLKVPGVDIKMGFMKARQGHEKYTFISSTFHGDTLKLQVNTQTRENQQVQKIIQVVFEHANLAYFKIGDHDFVKLSRDYPPELMDYVAQFELEKTFKHGAFSSYLPEIKSLHKLPQSLINIWRSRSGKANESTSRLFSIFPDGIHTFNTIWQVDQVFHFDSSYVVIGKSSFHDYKKIFVIDQNGDLIDFQEINLSSSDVKPSTKSVLNSIRETDSQIDLKDLPDSFFNTYSYQPTGFWNTLLLRRENFKLNPTGTVNINGQNYLLKRVYTYWDRSADSSHSELGKTVIFELADKGLVFQARCQLTDGELNNIMVWQQDPLDTSNKISFKTYLEGTTLNWLFFFQLLGITIILLVGSLIFYRLFILPRRLKNRLNLIKLEGVKSQLNPHFLFNSMASIQSLMNQQKTQEANKYLNELSDLLRYHLDTGAEELVPLSEELSAIEHYCELERLRSPFDIDFEIDERIDPDLLEIPNQLLQPLVENAIKHGLRKTDAPKLRIRVQQLEQNFAILIEDNGPGIAQEKAYTDIPTIRKTHKGLSLVREKISLLKKRGIKVKFKIEDRVQDLGEMESGTIVKIELPLDI